MVVETSKHAERFVEMMKHPREKIYVHCTTIWLNGNAAKFVHRDNFLSICVWRDRGGGGERERYRQFGFDFVYMHTLPYQLNPISKCVRIESVVFFRILYRLNTKQCIQVLAI